MKSTKPRRTKRTNHDATAPRLCPEELFERILAPRTADAALQPGRVQIKPGVELEPIGQGSWYVVVDGKPVARYESREDAEQLARNW